MISLFLAIGCVEKNSKVDPGDSSDLDGSGYGSGSGSGDSDGDGDHKYLALPGASSTSGSSSSKCHDEGVDDTGDKVLDYHSFRLKGTGAAGVVHWSSRESEHLVEGGIEDDRVFVSDSRLHFRVLAKGSSPRGGRCVHQTDYKKLSLKVSIGRYGEIDALETMAFDNVKVNECSSVLRSRVVPSNTEAEPFWVEIHDVKWDHDCVWDPTGTENCTEDNDMRATWTGHCWQIELQMATDDTKDIPR